MKKRVGARLKFLIGPTRGRRINLTGKSMTIGRDPGNMIVIEDPFISRQHARIVIWNGAYFLEPLGSRNGTFVDDQLIAEPKRLKPGQRIRLAHLNVFVFEGETSNTTSVICQENIRIPSGNIRKTTIRCN